MLENEFFKAFDEYGIKNTNVLEVASLESELRIMTFNVHFWKNRYKETFEDQMSHYYHELKIRCGQLKIDFIQADINQDFNNILYTYLVKRSKMN